LVARSLEHTIGRVSYVQDLTSERLQFLTEAVDLLVFGHCCHATRVANVLLLRACRVRQDGRFVDLLGPYRIPPGPKMSSAALSDRRAIVHSVY